MKCAKRYEECCGIGQEVDEKGIDVVDVLFTALSREDPEVFIIICSVYFC